MTPNQSNWDSGPVGEGNYTVRQGDCIESIAYEHGLFWETVWNDPDNAELKRVRENPNALLPSDRVFIRDIREKKISGGTDQKHRFRRKGVPSSIHLVFKDEDDNPRAGEPYELTVDGTLFFSGSTGSNGEIHHTIPPDARVCSVILGEEEDLIEYEVKLGHVDPITEVSGVASRLINLGYNCGSEGDEVTPRLRQAIGAFQEEMGLPPTGEMDNATLSALEDAYGS